MNSMQEFDSFWTAEKYEDLKKAFSNSETPVFVFEGEEYYKPYAKFVLEYLSHRYSNA